MPNLLHTTEGHWSYLYRAGFARHVPYPTGLKMGQDSIFLVNALARARSVTLIPEVVYHYRANPTSAMNTFTFRKFMDALEWRRRAWHVLRDHGFQSIGDRLLLTYWSDTFFSSLASAATPEELHSFLHALRSSLQQAGLVAPSDKASQLVQTLFSKVLADDIIGARALLRNQVRTKPAPKPPSKSTSVSGMADRSLKVMTFCSLDYGGAATGSHRRIEALRRRNLGVTLHSLHSKSGRDYARRVTALKDGINLKDGNEVWEEVRKRAILPALDIKGFCAQELFSLARTVVDVRKLKPAVDSADILHFHWVVGMFDYANAEEFADKPLVWTLADMNAFTGGCHYSEGCTGYQNECRNCPLLGGQSDLAHESWKIKKTAYKELNRLHIICPSQWMADHVAKSSLLGDKPIHVIPNAFPIERLSPTNKLVARIKLGLPLQKKLLLFGADSVANRRKGGEWLKVALNEIAQRGTTNVEVVLFGNGKIDLPLAAHRLGHISDEEHLALAYSAVDAFLLPSLEDNAPLTVGESLLCGTPVVAFPVGNVPELLRHLETGYIARYLDVHDLVSGIDWVLGADVSTSLRRSIRCRRSAAAFHDPLLAADRHVAVYQMAMNND